MPLYNTCTGACYLLSLVLVVVTIRHVEFEAIYDLHPFCDKKTNSDLERYHEELATTTALSPQIEGMTAFIFDPTSDRRMTDILIFFPSSAETRQGKVRSAT